VEEERNQRKKRNGVVMVHGTAWNNGATHRKGMDSWREL